jgi:hypothetical protein
MLTKHLWNGTDGRRWWLTDSLLMMSQIGEKRHLRWTDRLGVATFLVCVSLLSACPCLVLSKIISKIISNVHAYVALMLLSTWSTGPPHVTPPVIPISHPRTWVSEPLPGYGSLPRVTAHVHSRTFARPTAGSMTKRPLDGPHSATRSTSAS